jgi:hypothetical protein
MNAGFGGDIPAAFYMFKDDTGKSVKMPMDEAVSQGIINTPMNTYQVMQVYYLNFNPAKFDTTFFMSIAALNYYSSTDVPMPEIYQALERDDIRAAMLQEYNIVKDVSTQWNKILEPLRKQQRQARRESKI